MDAWDIWDLPGKFVNQQTNYSATCATYVRNDALLAITGKNLTTGCWYVNKPGGKVGVNANLHFSNGQYVSVTTDGNFTVYRPTAQTTNIELQPHYIISNNLGLTCKLQLGNSSGDGDLSYRVDIHSKLPYTGDANITQLITANFSNPLYVFSDERCDGPEFYYSTPGRVIGDGFTGLNDGPFDIWEHPNIVSLSSQRLCRFQPDGGIPVTLGIIHWETVGVAEQDIWGHWAITEDATSVPDGDGPDRSDEFPVWKKTVGLH